MRLIRSLTACAAGVMLLHAAKAQEPSAAVAGDRGRVAFGPGVLIANLMLAHGDKNGDQRLAREEFAKLAATWFEQLDAGAAGKLSQEEFLRRFESLAPPPPTFASRAGRGVTNLGNSRFLGLFLALDADHNGILTQPELTAAFVKWATDWSAPGAAEVNREQLVAGLNVALPKTNMGAATGQESQERPAGLATAPASPILDPGAAAQAHRLVDGFHIELVASEPLVQDPISITFDADGRMYVLELRSFMVNIEGTHEREPVSRISRLEDLDGDGRFDQSTIFVDQLVLPRSILATHGGVLYVADGKLYFARDEDGDGRADRQQLVDADYGGGNLEHSPNGLLPAMDNWIYNARSRVRYRWAGETLLKQTTENRGQWGLTQDNYGRLLYNVNNSQLLGDFTPPNYLNRSTNFPSTAGQNIFVATDQRVFPIRMNTAVNRGYVADVLSPEGRAYVFASSCSPVVYRGDNFPPAFVGNAFVCDPALNLLKRNVVFDGPLTLNSRFAYEDREFLASSDERFRPVHACNGPDGTLWVVDMYRGIVQHGLFMTSYLRRDTLERGLDQGIHLGRIYRIVSDFTPAAAFPKLNGETSSQLVARLAHPNGWIRDTAQRLLVERHELAIIPELLQLMNSTNELARIHALWTLEGLILWPEAQPGATPQQRSKDGIELREIPPGFVWQAPELTEELLVACRRALRDSQPKGQLAALRVLESLTQCKSSRQHQLLGDFAVLAANAADEVLFQIALTAGNLPKPEALPLLANIATQAADEFMIREAIITGLQNWELPFLTILLQDPAWATQRPGQAAMIQTLSGAVLAERQPVKIGQLLALAGSESTEHVWRAQALLTGMLEFKQRRAPKPVRFEQPPAAIAKLSGATDARLRSQAEQINTLFAWPGHQWTETTSPPETKASLSAADETVLAEGHQLYQQICAGCHGLSGEGLKPLAPPLVNSEWVSGSEARLIRILLHGIAGPIQVSGTVYQPPDIQAEMPPLAALADAQIAAVLSYVRTEWGQQAGMIFPARVAGIRQETRDRESPWTEALLLEAP